MSADDEPVSSHQGHTPRATGKTAGDVLDNILSNPQRWFALFLLLAGIAGLIVLVMLVFTRLFHVQVKELHLGGSNSNIVFQSIDKQAGTEQSMVIVSPQGWQKTIEVSAGDRLSFFASGRICIDLHSIWKQTELRRQYEQELVDAHKVNPADPNQKPPEDYFNPEQRKSLVLERAWVDAGGYSLNDFQPSFRSRRSRYLLPDQNAGALVAAIKTDSEGQPGRSDAFFVGQSKEDYQVRQKGWLWFTVNDVQSDDPANPNLFYNDNLGLFWVRVVKTGS